MIRRIAPMRNLSTCSAAAGAALLAGLLVAAPAAAQDEPLPPPPPPGYDDPGQQGLPPPPPPGYGQPPPYYGQQPGYGYPPPPSSLGPKRMDYEEGQPVPPGYHVDTRMRKGLVIGGAVMFGVAYFFSAFVASVAVDTNERGFEPLYIPAAGPFVALGTIPGTSASGKFLLVIDGLVQAGGLAMFIGGIAAPKTELVRNDVSRAEPPKPKFTVVPMRLGMDGSGLGIVGSM